MATISEATRRWRMVEAACLLAVSLSLYAVMVLAGSIIPPLVIFGTLYLVLAVLLVRLIGNRWLAGVAAVLAVLGLAGNAPFLIEDLAHPESWGSFVPSAISVVAGLGAVFAAVASYRGASVDLVRPTGIAVAGLCAALVVVSLGLSASASSDEAQTGDVTVLAEAYEYPETLSASAGAIGFFVENKDLLRHTFVIDGHDVKVELPSGKSRRVEVELPAGTYAYLCDVPGHESMAGTLTVQ